MGPKLALLRSLPSTSVQGLVPEGCLCSSLPPPVPPSPAPPPLPFALLRCYAERYDDLLRGFCKGSVEDCRWEDLYDHFATHGKQDAASSLRTQTNPSEGAVELSPHGPVLAFPMASCIRT